jgi:beta-lactamase regulating signal transducer with metallopeptidase domain
MTMADLIVAGLTAWLSTWLLHSTLLLGVAWIASRLLGARAAALRAHLWRAALVGALVTATAQTSGLVTRLPQADIDPQAWRAALAAPIRSAAAPLAAAPAAADDSGGARAPRAAAADQRGHAANASAIAPPVATPGRLEAFTKDWTDWALLLWAAGAALGLLRLAVLALLARRELADRRAALGALHDELTQLAAAHGMAPPRLSVSATLGGPVSLPNGEIVLPEWCLELAPRQRAALLAHELAHQRHADPQWLSAALVLHSLLWVQPLLGVARRELAALAELEADAWAARAVDDPRALAECLARCAEHMVADRAALFGAAMADAGAGASPLMQRIDRLLEGVHMTVKQTPVTARVGVVVALVAGVFLLPGVVLGERDVFESFGTSIHIDDDGDGVRASIRRNGYQAKLEVDGKYALDDTESDVARLAPGAEFELMEKKGGIKHEYRVEADGKGALTRSYKRDGKAAAFDAAAKQWLAEALPRLMRETGIDAEARVGRFLKRGGAAAVFGEIDLIGADYSKASYLGALLSQAQLSGPELDRALAIASGIGSDYEKRRALSAALTKQKVADPQLAMLLKAGATIGSDFERAELLTAAARHLGADAAVREAWLAAADGIGSDFELRRALAEGVEHRGSDPALVAGALGIAAKRMGSDFELRTLLESAAPGVGADRALADAYLAATRAIDSDFERREALNALLDGSRLDAAGLDGVLTSTAGMGSSFERRQVLEKLASKVAGDAALAKRYREVARGLDDFERGEALKALDDATRM